MFHKTKVDLQKWFFAIRQSDISVRKLAVEIGVTKDTASFMLSRIRIASKANAELIKIFKENIWAS
jgi:hypothetical protein